MYVTALMENTESSFCSGMQVEHGLSLFIETAGRVLLFDMGQSAAFASNAEKLGRDLRRTDTAVLSHGHYDHGGGLAAFLETNDHAPVYVHPCVWEGHYHGEKYIGLHPSFRALLGERERHPDSDWFDLGDGLTLWSGRTIRPVYPTECGGLTVLENGVQVPEDFRHEQYLLAREKNRTVLFSGCSHRGIRNILEELRRCGIVPDVVVGGFHYKNLHTDHPADCAELEEAAVWLREFPTIFYTCHCTGEAPYRYMRKIMGNQLRYLACGEEIHL